MALEQGTKHGIRHFPKAVMDYYKTFTANIESDLTRVAGIAKREWKSLRSLVSCVLTSLGALHSFSMQIAEATSRLCRRRKIVVKECP